MAASRKEMFNVIFGATSYDEDTPSLRSQCYYFTLSDEAPYQREVVIARLFESDSAKAQYIVDYIQSNTNKFKTSKDIISFFNKALDYQFDADGYRNSVRLPVGYRFDLLKRDGYKCTICGRSASEGVKLEVDHIIPRSVGGSDDASNLQTLCFDCNRGRSNKKLFKQ